MIDAPGPWGTGPFTLAEGYSSIENEIAIISPDPLVCTWLPTRENRTDRVVLEANTSYWNTERGPRLERVIYRNDLSPADALEACLTTEGEVDIVSEVAAADAARVVGSEYANLVSIDAMRVLVGVINRGAEDVPLDDQRARQALNLAIDCDKLVADGFAGYATPLAGLTPPWAAGSPEGQEPYRHDPDQAAELFAKAGWPKGRALRLAAASPDLEPVARMIAEDLRTSLRIDVDVTVVAPETAVAAQRMIVEKKLRLPFDVLLHEWFDLSSDSPPGVMHREYFHSTGAFRTGPVIPEFEELMEQYLVAIDTDRNAQIAAQIDRLAYDEALAVFLVSPKALYAVNRHVSFTAYQTTLELAECEVDADHWSRR